MKSTAGADAGSASLADAVFGIQPNVPVLHQVVTAQLAKRRAGTLKRAIVASFPALLPSAKSVLFKLFKGKATVVGRKSEHSLYSKKLATYEGGDLFDHDAAKGFIRLHGLGQQTQAQLQLLKGGRGFSLPGLLGRKKD